MMQRGVGKSGAICEVIFISQKLSTKHTVKSDLVGGGAVGGGKIRGLVSAGSCREVGGET